MNGNQELNILVESSVEKNYGDSLSRFIATVKSTFDCSDISYFELSLKQDCLLMMDSTRAMPPGYSHEDVVFSVTETDNPLVYALISSKAYLVNKPFMLGQGTAYEDFIKHWAPKKSILCFPVFSEPRKARGILLLEGDPACLEALKENTDFKTMSTIFANTLNLHQVIESKKHEAGRLHRVSHQMNRAEIDNQAMQHIANQLLGKCNAMVRLHRDIMQVSRSDVTVMLRGETGVGKDVAALAIHRASIRRSHPFTVVNCAAIAEHMFEVEFFGYRKGAFEGAQDDKSGLIHQANGGTLYLDEVSSLSLSLQAKLLRVLEEKTFFPLGGEQEQKSDFRLITATHQPLESRVDAGEFRPDLFYRINQYMITLPVLQQRIEDMPILLDHFILVYRQEHRHHIKGYEPGVVRALQQYDFPGNIRELKNIVFKACLTTAPGEKISERDIRDHIMNTSSIREDADFKMGFGLENMVGTNLSEFCSSIEQKIIRKTLEQCAGSRSKAAKKLGIPKRTLAYKCKKWDIVVEY